MTEQSTTAPEAEETVQQIAERKLQELAEDPMEIDIGWFSGVSEDDGDRVSFQRVWDRAAEILNMIPGAWLKLQRQWFTSHLRLRQTYLKISLSPDGGDGRAASRARTNVVYYTDRLAKAREEVTRLEKQLETTIAEANRIRDAHVAACISDMTAQEKNAAIARNNLLNELEKPIVAKQEGRL